VNKYRVLVCLFTSLICGCQSQALQEKQGKETVNSDFSMPASIDTDKQDVGFQIRGKNQAGKLPSSLENNVWSMGEITIDSWPLGLHFCKQCYAQLGRGHHPDGATQWLKIINESGAKMFVVSSYQKQFNALGWHFKHEGNKVKIIQTNSRFETLIDAVVRKSSPLNADQECSVLWANKHYLKQPKPGISNDVAQYRAQFILKCDA